MPKHTDRLDRSSRRRAFLKSVGAAGALGLGVSLDSHRAAADNINPGGGDGPTNIEFSSTQSDDFGHYISATTKVKHLGTTTLSDGRYDHAYKIVHESVTTDVVTGDKVSELSGQQHRWDATDDEVDVDCLTDDESDNVGAWPLDGLLASAPNEVFGTMIEAAASALSTEAGVVIGSAVIIDEILNAITDFAESDDAKHWDWAHNDILGHPTDTVTHQMEPVYRHDSSKSTWWYITAIADTHGNRVEFYSGDPPDLYATSWDGVDDVDGYSTSSTQTNSPSKAGAPTILGHTPGLEKADLHALPPTSSMTTKERKKYGVREPTAEERRLFGTEDAEVVSMIDRYPMTYVGRPSFPAEE